VEHSVLYEDNDLIALNKDSGIPAIPGRGKDTDTSLLQFAEVNLSQKLFVVHRIDKDTSGVILFAKNAATHRHLNIQFEKKMVKKHYCAVVQGIPEKGMVIDSPIYEFGSGRMGVDKKGKPSCTEFDIAEHFDNAAYLNVYPSTGRRHQIRVHLYSIGFPILGDRVYGTPRPVGGIERLMLHARLICFTHSDGTSRTIEAPYSSQWNAIVMKLRDRS